MTFLTACYAAGAAATAATVPETPTRLIIDTAATQTKRPLPVLLVIADRQDFYYQEYGDTRRSLEGAGLTVKVAATTTERSIPHPNSGEPAGTDGGIQPDLTLAEVRPSEYSAIAFVGGWGASMYQYAFNDPNFDGVTDNFYWHAPYNGDEDLEDGEIAEPKVIVKQLIRDFLATGKPVAGICHGTTVLAWARVDGVSPIAGRQVAVPFIGSPAAYYLDRWYGDFELGQYEQVVANGGIANVVSGQYGNPNTAADDVVVDGRIITAENYDSALHFGRVIAKQVIAGTPSQKPPRRLQIRPR